MCKIISKKKIVYFSVIIFIIFCTIFLAREPLLRGVGNQLVHSDTPEKADLIVMLRGGLFDRSIQTAEIYKNGYAPKILLPKSLADNIPAQFAVHGILVDNYQTRLRDILIQAGVSPEHILMSTLNPGGGTLGEARRVRKDIETTEDIKSIIVVTSWFHTRRSHRIYSAIFKGSGIKVQQ